jgi:hypothetical protein
MKEDMESIDIEQLLAEADELVKQINSDAIKDMKGQHLIEFEKHTQNLEQIKSATQAEGKNKGARETGSQAEGTHEAILDILKAMRGMTKDLS